MLDTETRRRIDTARDILVGKVPDPKSQVEQITIALIYKFMDDMDIQAEELGGKRKFFTGDFTKYGWAKLMRSGLGGHETLDLYAEAITRMPENPGIPPLFREIFKNAFLPYRDPETLRAFLKIIDDFEYDHSERLGDAFEYLLSVLGSQGNAGQFRTPRHIIDFMVQIVDPKKDETILDPACGTAGFLISSYKHILRANSTPDAIASDGGSGDSALHTSQIPAAKGDLLTPDERKALAENFRGYDISPDMVRLSLVNLYLHGFTDPHIFEYDTLTSQERWNEYGDVILANPPFMTPKGGIKPHRRFSVQTKRSEVLFVDYIAEHLTPTGRAAVIVPEGVLYNAQSSYKKLRRMLVDNFVVAVVSLPQGVFEPYSGVKTSIVFIDRTRARNASSVLFVRIDNDGYELSSSRRPKDANDLPQAAVLLREWCAAIDGQADITAVELPPTSMSVPRATMSDQGAYELTANSYLTFTPPEGSKYKWIPLRDLLKPSTSGKVGEDDSLPVLSITMKDGLVDQRDKFKKRIASADISGYRKVARNELVVGFPLDEGVIGVQTMYPHAAVSPAYHVWSIDQKRLYMPFFEMVLRSEQARAIYRAKMRGTTGRRRTLDKPGFVSIMVPVPPIDVQRKMMEELASYEQKIEALQKEMSDARARSLKRVWGLEDPTAEDKV